MVQVKGSWSCLEMESLVSAGEVGSERPLQNDEQLAISEYVSGWLVRDGPAGVWPISWPLNLCKDLLSWLQKLFHRPQLLHLSCRINLGNMHAQAGALKDHL